ncbi:MAG: type II toxin-antitoxin system CcdA family antitoxin [Pseudomonadota bacterium]
MNDPTPVRRRKAINVSLDPKLVEEAKVLGLNISRACEAGLAEETKQARWAAWRKENAEAIASSNAYVEKYGLPLDPIRAF